MFNLLGLENPLGNGFFRIACFAARFCGFWPETRHSMCRTFHFVFALNAVGVGALGENLYGFVHLSDLVAALEAFCPGMTKAICMLKMTLFFFQQRQWLHIVQRIRSILKQATLHQNENLYTLQKHSYISGILTLALICFGNLTNMIFSLRPLTLNIYRKFTSQHTIEELPFKIDLPDILVKYPLYPLTYAILSASGLMTVMTFSAVDGFFIASCMYLSSMFCILQHDIQRIFHVNLKSPDYFTAQKNYKLRKQLAEIVERHNQINNLIHEFTRRFTLIILMHFLFAALTLCSSILNFKLNLNNSGVSILLYVCYSLAALTQLFLYCIGGSYVYESSLALAKTLYEIEWYKCDVQTRKMILMMLQRTQRAQTIAVPFFTLTLPAFTSIISTAGSYITLLNTFL